MTPERYILGVGTGRCGTHSLARLLNAQVGVCCHHERGPYLPWGAEPHHVKRAIRWLEEGGECKGHLRRPTLADVGYMWITALPALRERFGDRLTVIAIRRDREETIESFLAALPGYIHKNETKAHKQFPTYTDVPLVEAWGRWWDWYYEQIPDEEQVSMEYLNTRQGQGRILSKAGIPRAERIYLDSCHLNRR